MGNSLQGNSTNFRGTREFLVCLEYGAAGAYLGAYATDCKVTRTGSGTYTIKLPAYFARLLGGDITNTGVASALIDDTALKTTGVVTVTFTADPSVPRRVFIRLVAPTDDFNQRQNAPG